MQGLRRSGKKAFIPFLTAGYPDGESFETILRACAAADCIEIGLPFSDPVADGPSICHASEVALSAGMHAEALFDLLERQRDLPPIILMTYLNPVLAYGPEDFLRRAAARGVRGLLLTDLPPEDGQELFAAAAARDIASVLLVAPTTASTRMQQIASAATGFLYAVAVTGTTGAREALGSQAQEIVRRLRPLTALPVVVGFGISTEAQIRQVCRFADGVVMGSALIDWLRLHADRSTLAVDFASHLGRLAAAAHPGPS